MPVSIVPPNLKFHLEVFAFSCGPNEARFTSLRVLPAPSTSSSLGTDSKDGTARSAHHFIGRCPMRLRGGGDVRQTTQTHEDEAGLEFQGYSQNPRRRE